MIGSRLKRFYKQHVVILRNGTHVVRGHAFCRIGPHRHARIRFPSNDKQQAAWL